MGDLSGDRVDDDDNYFTVMHQSVTVNPQPGGVPEQQPQQQQVVLAPGGEVSPGMTGGTQAAIGGHYYMAPNGMHPGLIGNSSFSNNNAGGGSGPVMAPQGLEWKMLTIDFSAAASLKELDKKGGTWVLPLSALLKDAPWIKQLSQSTQRVGGLEVVQAVHNFPFQLGILLKLPDLDSSSNNSNKAASKLPAANYTVTSDEPGSFTLRSGQEIKATAPLRILTPPEALEVSILSTYGRRPDNNEPKWNPKNLHKGIVEHPTQPHALRLVEQNHPIIDQIRAEKQRYHGEGFQMDQPDQNGLYVVAKEDIERHHANLVKDWAKSIKMGDLVGLELHVSRTTVEGAKSGEATESIWTNPAEIFDGLNPTGKPGQTAREALTKSGKKYRLFMTLGVQYADVY